MELHSQPHRCVLISVSELPTCCHRILTYERGC
uniref:Uncharacterized protein n=1 Tax=Arundo donax TaxID=35708 RepID=A0A0A8YJ20_ARUDO